MVHVTLQTCKHSRKTSDNQSSKILKENWSRTNIKRSKKFMNEFAHLSRHSKIRQHFVIDNYTLEVDNKIITAIEFFHYYTKLTVLCNIDIQAKYSSKIFNPSWKRTQASCANLAIVDKSSPWLLQQFTFTFR